MKKNKGVKNGNLKYLKEKKLCVLMKRK